MNDFSGLERLSELIAAVRIIGAVVVVLILAVGVLRSTRDTYFYFSIFFIAGYLLFIAAHIFKNVDRDNWITDADSQRAILQAAETWNFDPAEIKSIRLNVPLYKKANGRLSLSSIPISWERVWQLADPENGTFLEIGTNPVYRVTLLLGDLRCFGDDPNLVSIPGSNLEDFARGICLLAELVEQSDAEVILTYETESTQRGSGWDSRRELRLETKADGLIDRIVTASGAGTGKSFFRPELGDGSSRNIGYYVDGPIVALRSWLEDASRSESGLPELSEWRTDIAERAALSDDVLLAGMRNDRHMFLESRALFLACTQWDRASPDLRAAITKTLTEKLVESPKAKYLHNCGRASCTKDVYGLKEPKECLSAPPKVSLPKHE